MKKVLIITYYWPPSGGPASNRLLNFAKNLQHLGLDVYVLTVDPLQGTFPYFDDSLQEKTKGIKVFTSNTWEPFNLQKKFISNKKSEFKAFINENNNSFMQKISRFIRGNFFVPDPRRGWNKSALKKGSELIEKYNIDLIFTSSPPHSTQLIGLALKEKYKLSWIVDLRDPWTDIYFYRSFYHLPFIKLLDKYYESIVLKKANKIITVSEQLKTQFIKNQQVDPTKISVIINGFNEDDFNSLNRSNNNSSFIISHIGSLSSIHNINSFLKAFKGLVEIFPEFQVNLHLYGDVGNQVLEQINYLGISNNILIKGIVNYNDAISAMVNSSLLLFAVIDTPDNKTISSGKLLEYIASRTPILCLAPRDGAAAEIVSETESGEVFNHTEEDKIFEYLRLQLLKFKNNNLHKNQNTTYLKYSRLENSKNLKKIIDELIY